MKAKRESNKYTRLLTNTALFGISTFSSKVLSFVLTRLYTSVLAKASFGIVDLVTACANLLIPLVSLGISNAVIRFGLEKGVSKKGVFTGGFVAIFCGFGVLLLFLPLISRLEILAGHVMWMYIYVLVSCLRTLCCQFVRAKLYTQLYAIDGILSTLYTVAFNVLFLVVLDMGTVGYLLSIICADALSIIGLFVAASLRKYLSFRSFDGRLLKAMLKYSLPLVPAAMFWWITNASDRLFIAQMMGPAENGLYAAAYKVPSIVALLSTIFTEAWQLSAVTDGQGRGRERFFSRIYAALMGVCFVMGGGLVVGSKIVMRVLVAPDYYEAWRYVPLLIVATVFSTLVGFTNSVYMVEKRSNLALVTMLAGAVTNLALNWLFIPWWGSNGAAFATFLSYLLVFIIRVINTQRLILINYAPAKTALNTILLLGQALLMIAEVNLWPLWCGLLLAALAVLNGGALYRSVAQLLGRRKGIRTNNR